MITQLPGFPDAVHDAQSTFRAVLNALAHPGTLYPIPPRVTAPPPLTSACAAACLTLLDLETTLWWQPGFSEEAGQWLQFHTGTRRVGQPHQGDFAVLWDSASLPELALFHPGVAEYPEASTTLLVQVPHLNQGTPVELQGPGILGTRAIAPPLPPSFWPQWQMNHQRYPLGVDVLLFSPTEVMGLPRTTQFLSASALI